MALSLNGVAACRVKKEVENLAEGGTEEDLALRAVSSCGTCLGTEEDLSVLFSSGLDGLYIPVIYLM